MRILMLLSACLIVTACDQQTTSQPPTTESPNYAICNDDIAKFCEGVQPGEGRVVACLRDHKDQVSQPCIDLHKL